MRVLTLAAVSLSLLALVPAAGAKPAVAAAPTKLHGFLLRADEPVSNSFSRTPSFAWNPVAGAVSYQFQLATSSSFRENGLLLTLTGLKTPVAAPTLTLPWITGSPHALFARVRAITHSSTTRWSAPFGFDMEPGAAPKPLPADAGLLRWTPIEGADAYQVWFVDINNPTPKMEIVYTNVLDEREFYTFHRTASWTGSVRWRVRAIRMDRADDKKSRANGLPATAYGPWSSVYSSSNPAYQGGPIRLVKTISDVSSSGDNSSPAHRLMPAFVFTGDQAADGTSAELFRIYIFTDRQCLNEVYTSAVIGGPAYAPRPYGPLALPTVDAGITLARSVYLPDGAEPAAYAFDGQQVKTNESNASATPTTAVPLDSDSNPGGTEAPAAGPDQFTITGDPGAPVDLWDTEWPSSGYYWTVIPVAAVSPGALATNVAVGTSDGASSAEVVSALGYSGGDTVQIGNSGNQESATIVGATGTTLTFSGPLKFVHGAGEPVLRTGGNLQYQDLELPQDVCAAPINRVARFGKNSEPSLTAAGEMFASGLSPKGRLTAGRMSQAFYGNPLVAWTPALGATVYEVQWSKKAYPFKPEKNPLNANALGTMTLGTSVVLPLKPGTWYYRVRGFNYSLPTGAQQMSWSDPAKIVVAKPKFTLVSGKSKKK
jgi:hypothetical protein